MSYVIEMLQTALRNELQAKAEAEQYLDGIHGIESKYAEMTIKAFRESQRMAIDRIPQLERAISLLSNNK
jgi:hypothetical protein